MHVQSDVCIVGSGAIGKVTALGFAQAGLSVSLLGSAKQSSPSIGAQWDVRVFALNHIAREVLTSVGVWDAMEASRIAPVDAMVIKSDGVQDAGNLAFDAYGARIGELAWIVEDSNLNHALDSALKFAPNVKMIAAQAQHLHIDTHGTKVTLENGDTLEATLLIGADGAQSWVRNQCDIGIDYRAYGQCAIVTNFECEKPHQGIAYQWFSATEGIVALLPLPGNRVSLVWSAPEALAEQLMKEPLDRLAQRLAHFAEDNLGQLKPLQPEVVKAFPLVLMRAHDLVAPRVALVGDAAHVVHPLAGHGMNLGFADVAMLLKQVAGREAHRDCGDARVLSRYARSRKEDIVLMQLTTDSLQRLFAIDFAPLRILRNAGLNLLNKLPVIKRGLITHALGKRP
jgi:2-octaprenylphenol hydroxylase